MASLGEDLLATVNKLQDLVFNTIGNDSLDLPQIVRLPRETCVQTRQLTHTRSLSDHSPPASRQYSRTLSEETSCHEVAVS